MFPPKENDRYADALSAWPGTPPPGRQSSIPAPVFAKAYRAEGLAAVPFSPTAQGKLERN